MRFTVAIVANDSPYNFQIPISVHRKDGNIGIELRKFTANPESMKIILSAAIHNHPISIFPMFTNPILSLNSLIEHGVISYNPGKNQYYFILEEKKD